MKNGIVIITIILLILVSGTAGYFLRAKTEKPIQINPTPIYLPSRVDTTKFVKKLAYQDSLIKYWKAKFVKASNYPNITFVPTKKDSSFVQSNPEKADSLKLVHCSEDVQIATFIIGKQDTVNKLLNNRIKRVTDDLDICTNNFAKLSIQKQQAETQLTQIDKKLSRWRGIGIGGVFVAILVAIIKFL